MRLLRGELAGVPYEIRCVENYTDAGQAMQWACENDGVPMSLDTESNTWDVYAKGWFARMFQFGTKEIVYVLPIDEFRATVASICSLPRLWTAHNAPHDVRTLDMWWYQLTGSRELYPEMLNLFMDTRTMAHLRDSRGIDDGGIGHKLKDLCAAHIDPTADDGETALKAVFKRIQIPMPGVFYKSGPKKGQQRYRSANVQEGYGLIALDDEAYLRYSGMDVILGMHLFEWLLPQVGNHPLLAFEHKLQQICDRRMHRPGFRLDVSKAEELSSQYSVMIDAGEKACARFGLNNLNSPPQKIEVFTKLGANLKKRTNTGALSTDRHVLKELAKNDDDAGKLAKLVRWTTKMQKSKAAWIDSCLERRDPEDRVHPYINTMQAITARQSVDNPPTQQFPSAEPYPRGLVLADEGCTLFSADYDQIEPRIAGALSGEESMIQAAHEGRSMHELVCEIMYGPPPDGRSWKTSENRIYQLGKRTGLGSLYGGGVSGLAEQTGEPIEVCAKAVKQYKEGFPTLAAWKREIQDMVLERAFTPKQLKYYRSLTKQYWDADAATEEGKAERALVNEMQENLCRGKAGWVITPSGRKIYVEALRPYAAVNYIIQETARMVLTRSIIRVEEAGLGHTLLMPVHDELLGQDSKDRAEYTLERYVKLMSTEFHDVPLPASGELHGERWRAKED